MENLANKIRLMREHCRFTQEYVAQKLGVSSKTYRRLESRDADAARLLTVIRLLILAETFGVHPASFLEK